MLQLRLVAGLAALAIAGCTVPSSGSAPARPQSGGTPVPTASPPLASVAAPTPALTPVPPAERSSYQPFTLAAYQQAKAAGRPLFLYFYANWCPLCRPQEPIIVDLFGSSDGRELGIAGFRVNYDDNETDADEQSFARELGVNYQHTFFTFDGSGRQVWRFTGTQSREQLQARLEEIGR